MRFTVFSLLLVPTMALAQSPGRTTPVVFPPRASGALGQELALGITDRAGAELYATGYYNHLHIKQVLSMARHHGLTIDRLADPVVAKRSATLLGAQSGFYGTLSRLDKGWTLTGTVFDLRTNRHETMEHTLPADIAALVRDGGRALARALASLDGVELMDEEATIHPDTSLAEAMRNYLAGWSVLVRQPLGLRQSHVIDAGEINEARQHCIAATAADPQFAAAWAALSLASALALENEDAARALNHTRSVTGYLPLARLAQYWLATRFNSNAYGAVVLRDASREHPGALIFLAYLGEHLNITQKYSEALGVWNRYLKVVGHSPYAMAQKGYSMARLGHLQEAIDITRDASAADPESLHIKLELASRLVDAGRLDKAEKLLIPMVRAKDAWGEIALRLGYVYLLMNKKGRATKLLERALEMSTSPSEWRTRGRARYDLAIVQARQKKLKAAEDLLLAAANEGFIAAALLSKDPDLQSLRDRPRVTHLFNNPKIAPSESLLHATPFPVDQAGSPKPNEHRPDTGVAF
jgi:tetratricopeptide (TPR) repeat protein